MKSFDTYPSMFGQLSAMADMAAREASYALKTLQRAQKSAAPMERLQAVMENFDVMANTGCLGGEDNTRELQLLELLANKDRYRYEKRELYAQIADTLGAVEDAEWESEKEETESALESAGFARVERDDFEGWERGKEHVTIEMTHARKYSPRNSNPQFTGYEFRYTRDRLDVLFGVSGEFSKLVDVVELSHAEPAEAPAVPETTQGSGEVS